MLRSIAMGLGLAAILGACGKSTPCTGASCPQVAGVYEAQFTPALHCSLWAPHAPDIFDMDVTQSGSSVTMSLQPGADSPVHTFVGTIDANGSFSASEPTPTGVLNVAYASVTGNFAAGSSFLGTLTLNPPPHG